MNKKVIYLFIFMMFVLFIKETQASTDILNNVLTGCNTVLKEVGEVQNKISGKISEITSLKLSPDSLLKQLGGKLEALEREKERAENIKKKSEAVIERLEFAKDNIEELKARYDKLEKEYKDAYERINKGIEEGKNLVEKGKNIYEEGENKFQEAKEAIENIKGAVDEGIDLARDQISGLKENINLEQADKNTDIVAKGDSIVLDSTGVKQAKLSDVDSNNISIDRLGSEADTLASATKFAEETATQIDISDKLPNVETLKGKELKIKANDIMKNAANIDKSKQLKPAEIKTDIKMDDQLINSVNKAKKVEDAKKTTSEDVGNKISIKTQTPRTKFGEKKTLAADMIATDETPKTRIENPKMIKAKELVSKAAKDNSKQVTKGPDIKTINVLKEEMIKVNLTAGENTNVR